MPRPKTFGASAGCSCIQVAQAIEIAERVGAIVAALRVPLIDAPAGAVEQLQADVVAPRRPARR